MRLRLGSVVVAVVVAVSVSGCWPAHDAQPVMRVIPTAAAEGSTLVCGMDRAGLAVATGFAIGRTEGQLRVVDGVGAGVQ